jgi:hypothetical protein
MQPTFAELELGVATEMWENQAHTIKPLVKSCNCQDQALQALPYLKLVQ